MATDPDISIYEHEESFRDSVATINKEGKRNWIFPKKPAGRYYNARKIVAAICVAGLAIGPFLRWNGDPMFLFNILERKFIIFGITFWPQDFHLFVLALITFFVFIVLFTVIFGRVWCGWTCPQTVFMEMIFRPIEYLIDGDSTQQRKLSQGPWTREKIAKRALKYSIFAVIAFGIGNLVMAYMVGTDELQKLVTEGPSAHYGKFSFVFIFSAIFFFIFAYMREQACIVICPYGRLQGVLLDKDSMVVAYDFVRGEPRGKISKGQERKNGDCVSCNMCVAVCPTGIDIRNGTQLECVNCTACIDACDHVMDKVGFPRGLVRFASHSGIVEKVKLRITPRIIAYSVVLVVLMTVLVSLLAIRSDVEATVLRARGQLYTLTEDKMIANLYNYQVVNKTSHQLDNISFRMKSLPGTVEFVGGREKLEAPARGITTGSMFIKIPQEAIQESKLKVELEVYSGDRLIDTYTTTFLGPMKFK